MESGVRLYYIPSVSSIPSISSIPSEHYYELLNDIDIHEGQPFDYVKQSVLQHTAFCRDAIGLSPPFLLWALKSSQISIYLEDETGAVCGACGVNVKTDCLYIEGICVAVEKKRYGTLLINKISEIAVRLEKPKIILEAHKEANIDFYRKNGFSVLPDQERRQTLRSMSRNLFEEGLGRKKKRKRSGKKKSSKRNNKRRIKQYKILLVRRILHQ